MMAIERVFFLAFLSLEEAFPNGELCPRSALAREARLEEEARDAEKKRANDALKEDKSGRRVVREEGAEEGRKKKELDTRPLFTLPSAPQLSLSHPKEQNQGKGFALSLSCS